MQKKISDAMRDEPHDKWLSKDVQENAEAQEHQDEESEAQQILIDTTTAANALTITPENALLLQFARANGTLALNL